ncbi:uncharacterized protein LOC104901293 isoform X2 [Beta vulgaris subsp. vulgaris]|uniref:uncharacterized protein LOC104901293 isoform X2 n=1 Tax=Beta vulgaris subsp. vulgaris TaxID=3555 RepID=UPI00053FAB35|nr:uncharacterized protein LOC104901293 isoform X2 [Beta vulgaris subsp. vulgaris]
MAMLLRSANFRAPSPSLSTPISPLRPIKCSLSVTFKTKCYTTNTCLYSHNFPSKFSHKVAASKFVVLASSGEATETEEIQQPEIQENTDEALNGEAVQEEVSDDAKSDADEAPTSPVITALQLYKEALNNNDETTVGELEAFFKSIEDEKEMLERKVASMSEDLSVERDRVLRIGADFDNFRKRTERERSSLVTNAKGEVIENFLGVLDNFERAKSQIKIESEAEEKISNSYQSIYKQFVEILGSVGVVPVETVGKPFDPLVGNQVGLNFSRVFGKMIQFLNRGFSGFMTTWKR